MVASLKNKDFNCVTSYALERINAVKEEKIKPFFDNLPSDPYLTGKYRYRRLSRFKVVDEQIIKLPHDYLFQSRSYNPLLGDIKREYAEIEDGLVELEDFQKIVFEFFEFCQLCSTFNEIAVHQIRTTTSLDQVGLPAPEGIHRDGVDLVAIFCVSRENIEGGETYLYKSKIGRPVFTKILNPGEFLVFNDHQFFHFSSPIKLINSAQGIRDVFVLTCPGLRSPEHY